MDHGSGSMEMTMSVSSGFENSFMFSIKAIYSSNLSSYTLFLHRCGFMGARRKQFSLNSGKLKKLGLS